MIRLLIPLLYLWIPIHDPAPPAGELILEIENIKNPEGTLWIGVYDSPDNFLIQEKAIILGSAVEHTGSQKIQIPSIPYGTYAIALFHDLNGNDQLDRNWLGVPTEPYAFSHPPRSKWRLPRFEEIRFRFAYHRQQLKMQLTRW